MAEAILSQYSVIIRLARPNDTRKHCRPLVCCSAAVLQTGGQDQLVLETDGGGLCSDLGPCSTEGGEVAVILVQCTGSIRCLHCSRQHLAISPFSGPGQRGPAVTTFIYNLFTASISSDFSSVISYDTF